jgi:hypothetical protein
MILRAVLGVALIGVGVGLAASPEIGGLVSVGFVCFVAGIALATSAVLDVLRVE